jgi:hypothetical protein
MPFYLYRTPDIELPPPSASPTPSPQPSTAMGNLSGKQLSQSYNNSTGGKSSLTIGLSTQSNSCTSLSKTSRYD